MIFDIVIFALCTFVILEKTQNIWITAVVFAGSYVVIKAFGDNSIEVMLGYTAGMFVYGVLIFALLKKFHETDNRSAFIVVFCLATVAKGILLGWG